MAASPQQWDTDWSLSFRAIFESDLTNLNIYPSNPIGFFPIRDIPYGDKVAQTKVRDPNQDVTVSKDKEYHYKYASRIPIRLDMPSVTDALLIDDEDYASDSANALGHVADLNNNFFDKVGYNCVVGSSVSPLFYGIIDGGAGTGSTETYRPDPVDQAGALATAGAWTTYQNLATDLSTLENALEGEGYYGRKICATHPLVRPFLKNLVVDYTDTPYVTALGYTWVFSPYYDADATIDAVDLWMFDENAYEIDMTPIRARSYYQNNEEAYAWHWSTRAIPMPKPKYNDTDWIAGKVKLAIDINGA